MKQSVLTYTIAATLLICGLTMGSIGGVGVVVTEASAEPHGEVIDIEHESTVATDGEFEVTVETVNSAGTVVEFDFEAIDVTLTSDDAVSIDDTRVEFLDPAGGDSTFSISVEVDGGETGETGDIISWVNAEEADDADDIEQSSIELEASENTENEEDSETENGAVSLTHQEEVHPDEPLEVIVNTRNSAGTVVEVDTDGFEVDIDNKDAVVIDNERVEFLDPAAENSSYTIEIDMTDGTGGDTGEITAWVNSGTQGDADDVAVGTITITDDGEGDSSSGNDPESDEGESADDPANEGSDEDTMDQHDESTQDLSDVSVGDKSVDGNQYSTDDKMYRAGSLHFDGEGWLFPQSRTTIADVGPSPVSIR